MHKLAEQGTAGMLEDEKEDFVNKTAEAVRV